MLISKKIKNVIKFSAVIAASSIFTSCFNPVFSSIRKEVLLEEGSIHGQINSIVRFTKEGKEYLFMQNGNIYYKQVSDDEDATKLTNNMTTKAWNYCSESIGPLTYNYDTQTFNGWHVYKLASDENYVYALAYQGTYSDTYSRNIPTKIKLFCCSSIGGEWKEVTAINEAIENYISKLTESNYMMDSSIHLFCTNAPKAAHRKAYIRIGGSEDSSTYTVDVNSEANYGNTAAGNYGIIELNGNDESLKSISADTTTGANFKTLSAYWFNSGVYFSDYEAVSTNETRNADADKIYEGQGTTLVCKEAFDGAVTSSVSVGSGSIVSMAVTKDAIIVGTYEYGARKVIWSDGKLATSDFSTNADAIMTSPYIIRMLFCTDPSIGEEEAGSALYSSMVFRYTQSSASADYDNVGLWSYYSTRGNWNRE